MGKMKGVGADFACGRHPRVGIGGVDRAAMMESKDRHMGARSHGVNKSGSEMT